MVNRLFGLVNRMFRAEPAYAHCDVPCGIYDPHGAQIAALTVLRMNQLIAALEKPDSHADKKALDAYENTLGRYVTTKEQHAELVKREVLIIWGDYIRPEHVEKYQDLHTNVFSAMKLASRNKQNIDSQAAEDLVKAVQGFAETFWATKGVSTRRQPSNQTVGGEIVYPSA